jgi:hypothetical protein
VFLPQSLEQIPPCMGVWCFFSWFLHGFSMVFPWDTLMAKNVDS